MLKDMTAAEVRAARKRLGLTQAEFARIVGRTPRTIINWEQRGAPGWVRAVVAHAKPKKPKRVRN